MKYCQSKKKIMDIFLNLEIECISKCQIEEQYLDELYPNINLYYFGATSSQIINSQSSWNHTLTMNI